MSTLLFLTAFVLSGIAAYYSVIGLIAIFSAATLPVAIMGGSLEAAKLVVASWLYRYWKSIPFLMKAYFTSALIILMIITSMGIFGFLSKAHSDQSLVSGDVTAKIAVYDEKIKIAKDNIDANRRALKQMDEAVDQVMGRSTDEKGADKAVSIRRSQQKERSRLLAEIETEQKKVTSLNEERAPIAAEVRKVEAEVGPLKYIAAMIYGDNPDENSLERSVRWLIILLIAVFDPLAVLMLIAANLTQIKQKEWQEEKAEGNSPIGPSENLPVTVTNYEQDNGPLTEDQINQIKKQADTDKAQIELEWVDAQSKVEKQAEELKTDDTTKIIPNEVELPLVTETTEQQEAQQTDATLPEPSVQSDSTVEAVGQPIAEQPSKKQRKPRVNKPAVEQTEVADMERPGDYLTTTQKDSTIAEQQKAQDKLIGDDYFNADPEEVIDQMIQTGDGDALESAYKKIVKELARKNRSKTTHWGPLKTK
jgi:hypothetical protein